MPHYQIVVHKHRIARGKINVSELVRTNEALVMFASFDGNIETGMLLNIADEGYSDYVAEIQLIEPCLGLNKIRLHCKLLSDQQFIPLSKEHFGWLESSQLT